MRFSTGPKKATVTVTVTINEPGKAPDSRVRTFYCDELSDMSIAQDWVDVDDTPLGQPYRGRKPNGRTHFTLSIVNAKEKP